MSAPVDVLASSMFLTSALVTIVGTAVMLVGEFKKALSIRAIGKIVAVSGFLSAALANGLPHHSVGVVTLVALGFCALGDLLLLPDGAKRAFLLGLFSFLLGHVGFLVAFVTAGVSWWACALALLGLVPITALILRWLLPHVKAPMKVPVLLYVTAISLMVASAAGSVAGGGSVLGLIAAVAFFLSDLAVARERFVTNTVMNKVWGLPLYFGAQLAFAAWMNGGI
jgi:uncharacterized membrane protein YhhN